MMFINSSDANFKTNFEELLGRGKMDIAHVSAIVGNIIGEIQKDKNRALKEHISKFDNWTPSSDTDLKISTDSMSKAFEELEP